MHITGKRAHLMGVCAVSAGFALSQLMVPAVHASPTTMMNGILSTVGGCQTADTRTITSCTDLERLTPEIPIMLRLNPAGTRIVVLGAALNRDGSMKPVLVTRLQAALSLARTFPSSGVITTGGLPHGGTSEAQAMKRWLVAHGIPPQRVATEDRSRTTVENARNTARMLAAGRASGAVVISSPNHVRRAMINFRQAVRGSIPIAGVISGFTDGAAVPGAGSSGSGSGSAGSS